MKQVTCCFLCLACALCFAIPVLADSAEDCRYILARGADITSLRARFDQERSSPVLETPRCSRGVLVMRKPDYLLMEIESPSFQSIEISKGELLKRNAKKEIVERRSLGRYSELIERFYLMSSSYQELTDSYFIRCRHREGGYLVSLVPRAGPLRKRIIDIRLYLSSERLVERIDYTFKNQDRVTVRLYDMELSGPSSMNTQAR